eukprot:TRINITY_DN10822_c0_g1_i1.p1 TRINITY_DN10822_c0_g1~~TRINITY_DN10822_c0_g1_i1.p1  ORF type:complete len:645 (+),score=163.01 TRINITY_DN10822_c0_g1_i1:71-2005(+)
MASVLKESNQANIVSGHAKLDPMDAAIAKIKTVLTKKQFTLVDGIPTAILDAAEGVVLSIYGKRARHPLRHLLGHDSKLYIIHAEESKDSIKEPVDKAHDQSVLQEEEDEDLIGFASNTFVTVGSLEDATRVGFCGASSMLSNEPVSQAHCVLASPARLPLPIARRWASAASIVCNELKVKGVCAAAVEHRSIQYLGALGDGLQCEPFTVRVKNKRALTEKQLPALSELKDSYAQRYNITDDKKARVDAYAVYSITGACLQEATESALEVEFAWNAVTSLSAAPPFTAHMALHIRAIPGHEASAAASITRDLSILERLLDVRSACMQDGFDATLPWQESKQALTDQLEEFMASLNDDSAKLTSHKSAQEEVADAISTQTLAPRPDLDFTEKLWNFVKEASSYQELRQTLGFFLSALRKGQLSHPIHRGNATTIAAVALECMRALHTSSVKPSNQANLAAMMRDVAQPACRTAECTLELGLFTLRRDMLHHFIGLELATGAQLEPFMNTECDLDEQVENLHKLENVLELFVVAKTYVDLPLPSQRELISAGLEFYKTNSSHVHPIFQMAVPNFSTGASQLKRVCSALEPSMRSFTLHAQDHPSITHQFVNVIVPRNYIVYASDAVDAQDLKSDDTSAAFYHVQLQ